MKYNPAIHKRKSIRLKGYDYSQAGLYFITMCVHHRELLFGKIENDEMILNDAGKMIQTEWEKLPQRFSNIELDKFVVMPNHFHGILEIVGATDVFSPNNTDAQNNTAPVGATLVVALDDMVAPNEPVAPNDTVAKNETDAQNNTAPVGATLVVALDDMVAPNEPVAPNDTVAKNETDDQNDTGQPQTGATTRGAPTANAPDKAVGDIMAAFKSITTVEYIRGVKNSGWQPFNGKLWQRNYYEHIIRNEHSYENISDYILNNPSRWQDDKFYCA